MILVLAMPCACIDLANLRAVPDGGSPSGAGGAGSLTVQGGASSLGSGGEPVAGHSGTGGATAGSGGSPPAVPPGTVSVEVRDLDGDGTNEMIVVENTTGAPMVFEDQPGQPIGKPLPAGFAGRVVYGDFDGNGSTDLAFLSALPPLALGSGAWVEVLVTLNDRSAGAFAPPVVHDMGGMQADLGSPSLGALDVDGDGRLDLQVIGNGVTELLMNDGHGAFRIVVPTPAVAVHGAQSAECPSCGAVNPEVRAVP
jgi:hypothetical protein